LINCRTLLDIKGLRFLLVMLETSLLYKQLSSVWMRESSRLGPQRCRHI